MGRLSEFDRGFLTGLLVGEGHFGGDGRQPQIVLRMHVRHERIFRWLEDRFPSARLYGPYHHSGRHYFQWMARGRALVDEVLPELDLAQIAELDEDAAGRLSEMCERYAPYLDGLRRRADAARGPAVEDSR